MWGARWRDGHTSAQTCLSTLGLFVSVTNSKFRQLEKHGTSRTSIYVTQVCTGTPFQATIRLLVLFALAKYSAQFRGHCACASRKKAVRLWNAIKHLRGQPQRLYAKALQ